jgi:hypothetical protein
MGDRLDRTLARQIALAQYDQHRLDAKDPSMGKLYSRDAVADRARDEDALWRVAALLGSEQSLDALVERIRGEIERASDLLVEVDALAAAYPTQGWSTDLCHQQGDRMRDVLGPLPDDFHDSYDEWRDLRERLRDFVLQHA